MCMVHWYTHGEDYYRDTVHICIIHVHTTHWCETKIFSWLRTVLYHNIFFCNLLDSPIWLFTTQKLPPPRRKGRVHSKWSMNLVPLFFPLQPYEFRAQKRLKTAFLSLCENIAVYSTVACIWDTLRCGEKYLQRFNPHFIHIATVFSANIYIFFHL